MASSRESKQAVVLIHGIGEQIPMATLREFVNAVWTTDPSVRRPNVPGTAWSKPDTVSGNYELRRLTTAENLQGRRTDFFEFYWANLLTDTKITHVTAWIKVLLLRRPSRVPRQLRGIWWLLVLLTVLLIAGAVTYQFELIPEPKWFLPALAGIGVALWAAVGFFIIHYAGDAARYLHVAPPNIDARRKIREAGIDLLQKLHDSGKYDRIILVGHSLGSVIGYDILTHLWPRYYYDHARSPPLSPPTKLEEAEALARKSPLDDRDAFQSAQSALLNELRTQGSKWLVTDFVTLGSPLAHAEVLLARNTTEFTRKKDEREFPTCPPTLETVGGQLRFSYQPFKTYIPHHAAVFGVTRWTNLFFPCRFTFKGDVVGGPASPAFGPGVHDIAVETTIAAGFFSHTRYWEFPTPTSATTPAHITALRRALRIGR